MKTILQGKNISLNLFNNDYIIAYAPKAGLPTQIKPFWVQVVVAAVQGAMEMAKSQKFDRWQEDVSSKLDEILISLDRIQQQLRDMQGG